MFRLYELKNKAGTRRFGWIDHEPALSARTMVTLKDDGDTVWTVTYASREPLKDVSTKTFEVSSVQGRLRLNT